MKELFVTVTLPDHKEVTYMFDEYPIRIGRSKASHLAICHEAVPRELCVAWIEPDGHTVRVEERPHLTNPLIRGGTSVSGGVSGREINLSLGPLRLSFRARSERSTRKRSLGRGAVITGASAVVLLFACWVWLAKDTRHGSPDDVVANLPKTPFCSLKTVACDQGPSCIEQTRLISSRAREMLHGAGHSRTEQIMGASTLDAVARLYQSQSAPEAPRIIIEADEAMSRLAERYQRDVMALKTALRNGTKENIYITSKGLLADLADCGTSAKATLEKLIVANRPEEPEEKKRGKRARQEKEER